MKRLFSALCFTGLLPIAALAGASALPGETLELSTRPVAMTLYQARPELLHAARIEPAVVPAIRDAARIVVGLPAGLLTATRETLQSRPGGWTWEGPVNEGRGWAQFVFQDGRLAGFIQDLAGGRDYRIQPLADGTSAITLVDEERLPAEGEPLRPDGIPPSVDLAGPVPASRPQAGVTNLDVLVTYTAAAAADVGGHAGVAALAWANMAWANRAFRNNGLDLRMNLLAVKPTNLVEPEGDNWTPFMASIQSNATVQGWRNTWGADLVSLYVHRENAPLCGYGYIMSNGWVGAQFAPWAYNFVWTRCQGRTFAHESGHNMGLEHDRGSSENTPAQASFPWAYGYGTTDPSNNRAFRTVMAYIAVCEGYPCTQVWGYSTPERYVWNRPTGIADEADAERALNQTKGIVAAFRASQMIFQDGFEN